jgi:hypothetical protein
MQEEGQKNPELFRHHLHIDLSVEIPVPQGLDNMPPGSIFCNGLIPGAENPFGKCFFMCIPGFYNGNRFSYDGCEAKYDESPLGQSDIGSGDPIPYTPQQLVAPISVPAKPGQFTYPFRFGGYRIGDYEEETYLWFLTTLYGATFPPISQDSPIILPINIQYMQYQVSDLLAGFGYPVTPQLIVWY